MVKVVEFGFDKGTFWPIGAFTMLFPIWGFLVIGWTIGVVATWGDIGLTILGWVIVGWWYSTDFTPIGIIIGYIGYL